MKPEILPKVYSPKEVEPRIYSFWMSKGYFHAQIDRKKEPFTIVIPPPNITGSLHMGHALNNALQDVIVRRKRMQGFVTLWLPGTDHAGIATQNVVEKQLANEGLTRQALGREKFLERVWQWKELYGNTIIEQLKKLGCSCDWERERFTMDPGYSLAVKKVFVDLHKDGLIYRGKRIINWCPRCLTALSDIEVEHEEVEGHLWYIKYPFKASNEYLTIATTRPETLLGDTAVAVHPNDSRYKEYIGRTLILPCVGREIPIIADEYVDPQFGTGAVKVTPAHDPNDFEMGERHDLPRVNIFTPDAKINENGGDYMGMDRYGARETIVMDLEEGELLEKVERHTHAIGHCYRCHTIVEPYLSEQWFVEMKPLAAPVIGVVEEGRIKFVPKRWENVYFEWMKNIRDWCISRQIWWGHQIPVWYCECGEIVVQLEAPDVCPKCGSKNLVQDSDVLDTWFSSALWPFATLGWPEETEDLTYFYPTSVLSTARDIIYLWVARMIMMGLRFCGDIPFHTVVIHPTVLTIEGKRMSKSLGTGVDPLDLIEKYGADATRFGLMVQTQAQDMRFSEERLEMSRNFANKIWNASRFVLMNLEGYSIPEKPEYNLADKWILSRCNRIIKRVSKALDRYDFSESSRCLYDFFWSEYCDWYIEMCKSRLYGGSGDELGRLTAQHVLLYVLDRVLRLLHPFMPFITEEIWRKLPVGDGSIMVLAWPEVEDHLIHPKIEGEIRLLQDTIVAIRAIRSELRISPDKKIKGILCSPDEGKRKIVERGAVYISSLAGLSELVVEKKMARPKQSAMAVEHDIEIFIPLAGLIDVEQEIERLRRELANAQGELEGVQEKFSNKAFIRKAPKEIVGREKERLANLSSKLEKLNLQLKHLVDA
ncbi:MAG: valine--tRNA ligase [Actinomycetota bacterium]|nr:valine--tRNA ligase [Actinomycetota bacterium]